MEGCVHILLDVHRWSLRFKEKLTSSPDTKAVIRSFGSSTHFDSIFMDNVFVCLSIASLIAHVPTESLKKWIYKLNPKPGFVVFVRAICIAIAFKTLDQFQNFFGSSHPFLLKPFLKQKKYHCITLIQPKRSLKTVFR